MGERRGYRFEYYIKRGLERFLQEFDIKGRVRREYQRLPNYLGTDITIDTLDSRYYCAIECKSRKPINGRKVLTIFNKKRDGTSQFDIISDYLNDTGRKGYLAIELKLKPKAQAYLIPWPFVESCTGLSVEWICSFPELERAYDPIGYRFTPEMF